MTKKPMTVDQIVSQISFKNFVIPIELTCYRDHARQTWKIILRARVPDRTTGKMTPVQNDLHIDEYVLEKYAAGQFEDTILDMVREGAYRMLQHELDESLSYRGERIFDPHRDEVAA